MLGSPYNVWVNIYEDKLLMAKTTFAKEISASLEDYLEVIYKIFNEKQGVKAIEISRRLGVGRSSVTDALKALADKKLVNYGRYDVISLTEEGQKTAKEIISKHNILSEFLVHILGVSPQEADENACRIEHVISKNVADSFAKFVNADYEQRSKGKISFCPLCQKKND